jgi:hypothetical protein
MTNDGERSNKMKKCSWKGIPDVKSYLLLMLILLLVMGCAVPVREAFKVDQSRPVGSIQGDSFVGQRFPFTIKIPTGWQAATEYPEFLVEQGYGRESLKETPFFLFNPQTKSSMQVDFSPAGRTTRFNQKLIEDLVQMSGKSFVTEVHEEHGKGIPIKLSKMVSIQLKGVPYAARMSASFSDKGESRDQGWIYAFAEPYQIFILYFITGENNKFDQEALEKALSSFEYSGIQ